MLLTRTSTPPERSTVRRQRAPQAVARVIEPATVSVRSPPGPGPPARHEHVAARAADARRRRRGRRPSLGAPCRRAAALRGHARGADAPDRHVSPASRSTARSARSAASSTAASALRVGLQVGDRGALALQVTDGARTAHADATSRPSDRVERHRLRPRRTPPTVASRLTAKRHACAGEGVKPAVAGSVATDTSGAERAPLHRRGRSRATRARAAPLWYGRRSWRRPSSPLRGYAYPSAWRFS